MKITKAVITAASPAQRGLPLQMLVDRDGQQKSALQIIVEEAIAADIDQICIIVQPGDEIAYANAAGPHAQHCRFVAQDHPAGYGDAVLRAQAFVGDEPFLHLVGDHLYLSTAQRPCAKQVVTIAESNACSVSAVQATRETLLPNFGALGGKRIAGTPSLYQVDQVLEKPTPTEAEQSLIVPGLRAGYYLCFFGIHVLTPTIFDLIARDGGKRLSTALQDLTVCERYLALEVAGRRYDIGVKYGLLMAQLALVLSGNDRAEVLAGMVELLSK